MLKATGRKGRTEGDTEAGRKEKDSGTRERMKTKKVVRCKDEDWIKEDSRRKEEKQEGEAIVVMGWGWMKEEEPNDYCSALQKWRTVVWRL